MIAPELGSSYGQHIYFVILGAGWGGTPQGGRGVNTLYYSLPSQYHSSIWKSAGECQISGMIFDNIWSGEYLVARSSGICEISGAQSLKILRQITGGEVGS